MQYKKAIFFLAVLLLQVTRESVLSYENRKSCTLQLTCNEIITKSLSPKYQDIHQQIFHLFVAIGIVTGTVHMYRQQQTHDINFSGIALYYGDNLYN